MSHENRMKPTRLVETREFFNEKTPLAMVFDVESVGLHGEGFAVGWVVVNKEGKEKEAGLIACPANTARIFDSSDLRWVREHIPAFPTSAKVPRQVRDEFWGKWVYWKSRGAVLVADCPWPVETRFLAQAVDDDPVLRKWEGPYPLIDVGSVRAARGLDPLVTVERLPNELPQHNPLADSRQSARLLLEALNS